MDTSWPPRPSFQRHLVESAFFTKYTMFFYRVSPGVPLNGCRVLPRLLPCSACSARSSFVSCPPPPRASSPPAARSREEMAAARAARLAKLEQEQKDAKDQSAPPAMRRDSSAQRQQFLSEACRPTEESQRSERSAYSMSPMRSARFMHFLRSAYSVTASLRKLIVS